MIDSDYCHQYALSEAAGPFADAAGGRVADVVGTVAAVTGGVDTLGTGCLVARFSGLIAPPNAAGNPCTNTGVFYVPCEDVLGVCNFDDGTILVISTTDRTVQRIIALTGGPAAGSLQAAAFISTTGEIMAIGATGTTLYRYAWATGVYLGSVAFSGSSNTVCYDYARNALWVRGPGTSLRLISLTGVTILTLTVTGAAAGVQTEGLTDLVDTDTLLMTADTGDMVYEIDKTSGATLRSWPGPFDIEHLTYNHADQSVHLNADARYHSGGATDGENIVYKLTRTGQPWAWPAPTGSFACVFDWKPKNLGSTTVVAANWSAVKAGATMFEIQARLGGVVRVYLPSLAYMDSAAGAAVVGVWARWLLVYDAVAQTLTLSKATIDQPSPFGAYTQLKQATGVLYTGRPDGRLSIGGRANGSLIHNGVFANVELHRSARTPEYWAGVIVPPPPPPYPASVEGTLDGGTTWTALGSVSVPGNYAPTDLRVRT